MIEEEQEDEEGWRQVGKKKTKTQRRTPRGEKTKKNAAENPARPSIFAEGNGDERRRQMDDMGG